MSNYYARMRDYTLKVRISQIILYTYIETKPLFYIYINYLLYLIFIYFLETDQFLLYAASDGHTDIVKVPTFNFI